MARRNGEVVIVGGGPAGLAAAFALADRGVPVRVLEQGRVAGGKVYSEEVGGRSVEHGVHGWWSSYRNFFAILEQSGVHLDDAFVEESGTNLVVAPGEIVEMKPLSIPLPSPLFLAAQLLRAGYAGGIRTLVRMLPFSTHLLAFRHEKDFPRYDGESFEDFMMKVGVPAEVRDNLFRPFTLNLDYILPQDASAAAVLSAIQFYSLPSQTALLPRWTRGLPRHVVFDPLVKAIEGRSGCIETGASVTAFQIVDGVLRAVEADYVAGPDDATQQGKALIATVPAASIDPSNWTRIDVEGRTVAFVRRKNGGFETFLPRCTHQGGVLELDRPTQSFRCTTHTGVFDANGARSDGPPIVALPKQPPPAVDGSDLRVYAYRKPRLLACSDAILATDLVAAKRILSSSKGVPHGLLDRLDHLETTPVVVVRMWFAKGTPLSKRAYRTAITKACELVDNYFHLNQIDSSYDREGEVIEAQGARGFERWGTMSDQQVVDWVLKDLMDVGLLLRSVPHPDHAEVLRHPSVFTKYAPGDDAYRPGVRSGVAGLYLAGDWTKADWSAWFMERAVISGLRAANAVLAARGLEQFDIQRLPSDGLLLRLSRIVARAIRPLLPEADSAGQRT